jgi:hypothetical protein
MVSRLQQAIALLLMVITFGLTSCGGDRDIPVVLLEDPVASTAPNPLAGEISEVSPPERIQQLKPYLDVYEPQVRIVSPQKNEFLQDTTVAVELQVRDFPLYKDEKLGLGPHIHLFLDDQPYQAVYDTDAPIVFEELAPGTHTLRAFASRPWHESFKNAGAYDQVTFNVFAESPDRNPNDNQPLLTYSRPQGTYGAEPIMLDFYLTNAPLHLVAEEDESIPDWRIRCTVNGESFVFDRWQPIYLKGFKPGQNWVKLELIDENGNLIDNAFNTGIRVIDYAPDGHDGLSQLIRGEVSLAQAKVLVDPAYEPPTPVVEKAPTREAPMEPAASEPEVDTEASPLAAPMVPETETTNQPEPSIEEAPAETEPAVETAPLQAAPAVEEPESPPAPDQQLTEAETPTPIETTDEGSEVAPKQVTPIPAPEPIAEPGMLPEIIEGPQEPSVPPVPQADSVPGSRAEKPIAPIPSEATSPTADTLEPSPTDADAAPIIDLRDSVEEVVPLTESDTPSAPEPSNPMESRRQQRSRSRFSRDRLMPRDASEASPNIDQKRTPEAQTPEAVLPIESDTELSTDDATPASEIDLEAGKAPLDIPEDETASPDDESPLESLEEASGLI